LLYEVTVSGLKAIQVDFFQGSYQLGQRRGKLPFVLAHQLARVYACVADSAKPATRVPALSPSRIGGAGGTYRCAFGIALAIHRLTRIATLVITEILEKNGNGMRGGMPPDMR